STDEDGDDDIAKWEWDFTYDEGEGFIVESEEQNPEIRNYNVGFYPVMLRVTDSAGLSDMLDEPLLVEISEIATYIIVSEPDHMQAIFEIATDSNGDVFILGETAMGGYLKKFSEGQSLEWTVTFSIFASPDFTITDTDEIYLCGGYSNGFIMHIDSDGNIVNEITSQELTGNHYFKRGYSYIDTTPSGNIITVDAIHEYDGYTEWDPWFGPTWIVTYSEKYHTIQEFTPDLELINQTDTIPGPAEGLVVSDSGNIYIMESQFRKYDENIELIWSAYSSFGADSFVVDSDDNSYITGYWFIKYNSNGEVVWSLKRGRLIWDSGTDIAISGNRLFISGNLRNENDEEIDMDIGPGVHFHQLDFRENAYLTMYNLDGEYEDSLVWGTSYTGFSYMYDNQVTVDLYGNTYVAKHFRFDHDFDPGAGMNLIDLGSGYGNYTVLWKIFPF
ncbi:hypothetical protein KAU08_07875, partial [bacterium]|nr:hypothetical protein [bacterium]